MKEKLKLVLDKFLDFSDLTFNKINQFFYYLFDNLIANLSNFLISIIFLIILVFYQAIIEILNFELFGKEFLFGDGLNNLFSLGFEATWNLLIDLIRSFSPNGFLGLAFEIITETIAFILFLVGYAIVFFIYALKFLWFLITQLGFYNILVILSWSYLIGFYRFTFNIISEFIQSKKPQNKLIDTKDNTLVENSDLELK
tara:strand:- start:116 stop:712 length:597 start_codon:yes stop_codon:yes gene_type:complete